MDSLASGQQSEKELTSPAAGAADTSKYSGLLKLVAQVSKQEITPEAFLQGAYDIFKTIEEAYAQVRNELKSIPENEAEKSYLNSLASSIDDTYYMIHLGLMQFEAFVNSEEELGLRVGIQLIMSGINSFNDITARVQAVATGDDLYNSKDIICALGSAAWQNKESGEQFAASLQELTKLFTSLEDKARHLQEEVINGAKELIDYDEDRETLAEQARKVQSLMSKLEDAYGSLILASHSSQLVKQVAEAKIVERALD